MPANDLVAVVPLRLGGPRKSRLVGCLSPAERESLADELFDHVTSIVTNHPDVARTIVLSPVQPQSCSACWRADSGRGLNAELEILREEFRSDDLLVIHADLPLLAADDVTAMISARLQTGVSIAPDHMQTGTNALAVEAGRSFPFTFGSGSFAAHLGSTGGKASVVRRIGLALDIDRPEDLELAELQGFARNR